MNLTGRSTLRAVAMVVGVALRRNGIAAVLTGGACAHVYSGGRYQSADADFIVSDGATRAVVDRVMGQLGFRRTRDRYVHPRTRYYVEFPRGPLAIGSDFRIRPVEVRSRFGTMLSLSATDSCRDRLAAFYHWGDRQSLRLAVRIACANRVSLAKIRRWSIEEGSRDGFELFAREVRKARAHT